MKQRLEITKEEFDRKFNELVEWASHSNAFVPAVCYCKIELFFQAHKSLGNEVSANVVVADFGLFMSSFCEDNDPRKPFFKPFRNSEYFTQRLEDFRKIVHDKFDFNEEFYKIGDVVELKDGTRLVLVESSQHCIIALVADYQSISCRRWRNPVRVNFRIKITAEEMNKIVGDEYGYKKINAKWSIEIHE